MYGCARHTLPRWIFILAVFAGYPGIVSTTPHWTPEQIAKDFQHSGAADEPRFERPEQRRGRHALDEIAYFNHYRMLCDFLVSLQYSAAGANQGGMIEGESGNDHNIIQTDNTQEAIRVWSQYAIWTGDTARYGSNIRLAQGYCNRFPAWREGNGYYSIHNCGWGFEAERKYREAYQDTSWTWYADSCALWVVNNPLDYNPNSTGLGQLDPCAEGLGIGGMFPHALYRQRVDWQNFALQEARRLRTWFESNPQRLNANETWALCGGTALWGVCVSLFTLYPDSGRDWLAEYGPDLDIWQSTGQWNHSFNTWYCNAQYEVFNITLDSTYWENAIFITDSLIGLDTDHDGGIPPGRTYPVTNDHSWVSAYMGWMGMERIINTSPVRDVAAAGFVSPSDVPHLAGDSLPVAVRIINRGVIPMTSQVTVNGFAYYSQFNLDLEAGADTIRTLPAAWLLPDNETLPDQPRLQITVTSALDEDSSNDTLSAGFDIRRGCHVTGHVFGDNPPATVPCRVEFFHEAYPDSPWTVTQTAADEPYTNGTRPLMAGVNIIRVVPALEYMIQEQTATLSAQPLPTTIDFTLSRTVVALIDDDGGDSLERFFVSALDCTAMASRWWDKAAWGEADLSDIPAVIWFTGNDSVNTLDTNDQSLLERYLDEGGKLLLTGQNITDDLGSGSAFLTNVLHCSSRTTDTDERIANGYSGSSVGDGLLLYLIGTGGAWNQNSPASIEPLAGSNPEFRYSSSNGEPCGISGQYGAGRYIFLSFGLEAVSGVNASTTRHEVLEHCFSWFDLDANEPNSPLATSLVLWQNYPNPFNPATLIRFAAPVGGGPVKLVIYNLLGQRVRSLYHGPAGTGVQTVLWNGQTDAGTAAASGTYICRLEAAQETVVRTLQLLR